MYRVFVIVVLFTIRSINMLKMEPPCPVDVQGTRCDFGCVPPTESDHYKCSPSGQMICDYGWRGHNCQVPICTRRCNNGGLCVGPNQCSCRSGWHGASCEFCYTRPGCMNGDCRQPFDCLCRRGWKGWNCEQMVDVCEMKNPCLNGAKCVSQNAFQDTFICICAPGFGGINCSLRIAPLPVDEPTTSSPQPQPPSSLEPQANYSTLGTTTVAPVTTTLSAFINVNDTRQAEIQLTQKPMTTTSQIEILIAACVFLLFLIFIFLSCSTIIKIFKHYCNCKNNNQPNIDERRRSSICDLPSSNSSDRRYTSKDAKNPYSDYSSPTLLLSSPSPSNIITSTISMCHNAQIPLEKIIVIPSPPSSPPPSYASLQ